MNKIKSLLAYLRLPKEYVQKYYHNVPNTYTFDQSIVSAKINEIKDIDNNFLVFLNNIALASERLNE